MGGAHSAPAAGNDCIVGAGGKSNVKVSGRSGKSWAQGLANEEQCARARHDPNFARIVSAIQHLPAYPTKGLHQQTELTLAKASLIGAGVEHPAVTGALMHDADCKTSLLLYNLAPLAKGEQGKVFTGQAPKGTKGQTVEGKADAEGQRYLSSFLARCAEKGYMLDANKLTIARTFEGCDSFNAPGGEIFQTRSFAIEGPIEDLITLGAIVADMAARVVLVTNEGATLTDGKAYTKLVQHGSTVIKNTEPPLPSESNTACYATFDIHDPNDLLCDVKGGPQRIDAARSIICAHLFLEQAPTVGNGKKGAQATTGKPSITGKAASTATGEEGGEGAVKTVGSPAAAGSLASTTNGEKGGEGAEKAAGSQAAAGPSASNATGAAADGGALPAHLSDQANTCAAMVTNSLRQPFDLKKDQKKQLRGMGVKNTDNIHVLVYGRLCERDALRKAGAVTLFDSKLNFGFTITVTGSPRPRLVTEAVENGPILDLDSAPLLTPSKAMLACKNLRSALNRTYDFAKEGAALKGPLPAKPWSPSFFAPDSSLLYLDESSDEQMAGVLYDLVTKEPLSAASLKSMPGRPDVVSIPGKVAASAADDLTAAFLVLALRGKEQGAKAMMAKDAPRQEFVLLAEPPCTKAAVWAPAGLGGLTKAQQLGGGAATAGTYQHALAPYALLDAVLTDSPAAALARLPLTAGDVRTYYETLPDLFHALLSRERYTIPPEDQDMDLGDDDDLEDEDDDGETAASAFKRMKKELEAPAKP